MDILSKEMRSWNMSRIKSKDTAPELFIRSLLHRAGYRFRLHVKDLPGKPDIVLPRYKTVVEVRGCFWHHHLGCKNARIPPTRHEWWEKKLSENVQRDEKNTRELQRLGWKVIIIWECAINKKSQHEIEFFLTKNISEATCLPYVVFLDIDSTGNIYTYNHLGAKLNKELKSHRELPLWVTDKTNRSLPFYSWYNYKHSFARDFVLEMFRLLSIQSNEDITILDPFCGAGTSLLAAKEYGIKSIGIDIMPFSTFISEAKTMDYSIIKIGNAIARFRRYMRQQRNTSHNASKKYSLLEKYFDPKVLNFVLEIYEWIIQQHDNATQSFFKVAMFAILEKISCTKKDGGFIRLVDRVVDLDDVMTFMNTSLTKMHNDIKQFAIVGPRPQILTGDIRHLCIPPSSISLVITSPPYPNRHDYTRIYSLESILGFAENQSDLKAIRYNSIRSHVEAKRQQPSSNYVCPLKLQNIISELVEHKRDLPNKQVIAMINDYFEDMFIVLERLYEVLKPNGFFVMVVCDVRYGGIVIPVTELLNELALLVGFETENIVDARTKNNSAQQMKTYGRHPIKENILIWRK